MKYIGFIFYYFFLSKDGKGERRDLKIRHMRDLMISLDFDISPLHFAKAEILSPSQCYNRNTFPSIFLSIIILLASLSQKR